MWIELPKKYAPNKSYLTIGPVVKLSYTDIKKPVSIPYIVSTHGSDSWVLNQLTTKAV